MRKLLLDVVEEVRLSASPTTVDSKRTRFLLVDLLRAYFCAAICATSSVARAQSEDVNETGPVVGAPSRERLLNHLQLQLAAAFRVDFGTFPHQPAMGVQVQLAARVAPFYIAIGATYWPSGEQSLTPYPKARLGRNALFGDLGIGADVTAAPFVVTPLIAVELGQLQAEAVGVLRPDRNQLLWVALGPSMSVSAHVWDGWSVALELSGLMPAGHMHWFMSTLTGDVAVLDAASVVWRASARVAYVVRESERL